jgi:hypothetical protein
MSVSWNVPERLATGASISSGRLTMIEEKLGEGPASPPRASQSAMRGALEQPPLSAKFMIPADALDKLAFVLRRMDALMEEREQAIAASGQSATVHTDTDPPPEVFDTAVQQWADKFPALKAAEDRRRWAPQWDLENLVHLARGSPSLRLCRDLETHVLEFVHEISNLLVWRRDVCEQHLLPLQHFTHLTVICSRLARAKGQVRGLAALLVSQVRALFVESKDEYSLLLHKELLLRRDTGAKDIERMYETNEFLRKELKGSRAGERWTRMALIQEVALVERSARMLQRDLKAYIQKVKGRTSIKSILAMNADDLGIPLEEEDNVNLSDTGTKGGRFAEVVKRQHKLLKHVGVKVETHESQVKMRESKLLHQQEKYREAVQEYEAGVQEMQKKTAVIEAKAAEVEAERKQLAEDQSRLEINVKRARKELGTLQDEIAGKFEVLSKLEKDVSNRARAVEEAAREQLMSLKKHEAEGVAMQAHSALEFAYEASAYIKNTRVYPGKTDWKSVLTSNMGSRPGSANPHEDLPESPGRSHLSSTVSSFATAAGGLTSGISTAHLGTSSPELAKSEHCLNPTVEAFSDYIETMTNDDQRQFRIAILEKRLQVVDGLSLDELTERRLQELMRREQAFREREIRCHVIEESREKLEQNLLQVQQDLVQVTKQDFQNSLDEDQMIVAARIALREIELELQGESVRLQTLMLQEKMTGTPEEKEILKQVLASQAKDTLMSELAKEKEALEARARSLESEASTLQQRKIEVEQKEAQTSDLERQVQSALEKATAEQKAFEESSAARIQTLEEKERKVQAKINELHTYEGDESKIEAILTFKQTIADKEKQLLDKEKAIAKLEKELADSAENVQGTVDALVEKATQSLIKEMSKKEDRIEKREELVSAQSSRLEAEMSKIKEIARAEKSMREAENKLKRANEQLQINAKREEELNALAKALDREKEELRKKAQTASNEDLDGVVTAFDHKVRSLHQQIKDLKENEKKLQSKITKLEARSRGNSSAVSPKPQSRPRTDATKGDISKNEGWVAQYLDSENPTREELSQEAVRLSEVQKDLETRIEAYTQIKSDSELKLVDLELRQEKLAAREDALSKLMSKFGGLEDMTEDKFENLQEQFKTEMEAMVAEHESAKAEHRVRQELFERQIRDLEESCTRRVELLSSKSNIIEYVQKIDNAAVEHSDYLQHSENLKTLVTDPKTDISHLVALQVCSLLTSTIWHLSFPIDLDCPNLFKPSESI